MTESSNEEIVLPADRYSAGSRLREDRMRLISGIFAIKLMEEARYEEAKGYLKPLAEWVSTRSQQPSYLNPQNIEEIEDNSRATLISMVQGLQEGSRCTKEQLEKASHQLAGVLNGLRTS